MPDSKKPAPISDETIQLTADTLTGDIASWLIDRLREYECAYRYMSEDQQKTVIAEAKMAAENMVHVACGIMAADGRDTIPVSVKKVVNDGDKIQVTIEASKFSEQRHALFDAAGCAAHLTVIDSEKYQGGEGPKPEPDQRDMGLQAAE